MGDRSNIVVQEGEDESTQVWLYGHWMGNEAIHSAVHGLNSGRVGDPAYLTRIIFNHMTAGDETSETGFGISTKQQDNEYPIIIIDGESGNVRMQDYSYSGPSTTTAWVAKREFLEFAAQSGGSLRTLFGLMESVEVVLTPVD